MQRSAGMAWQCCARSHAQRDRPLNVMTHCNAGALATCGLGTATAPLFLAHAEGLPLHVWVSETRPRMQGANLTAWEMRQHGIPHTLFVDSASGLLMRRGDVDVVIVGADRVARNGDVCNKIGTYDKALAARDNDVPFCVALPSPTIDWSLASGDAIPIESRSAAEVLSVAGRDEARQRRSRGDRPGRYARRQLCVRRHAGATGDALPDRTRRRRRREGAARTLSGAQRCRLIRSRCAKRSSRRRSR